MSLVLLTCLGVFASTSPASTFSSSWTTMCAPDGIGLLRMVLGDRLDVGGPTADGRIDVVIRGPNEYALAGELAGLVEWLEVTGAPGVRHHLTSIGRSLVERYG